MADGTQNIGGVDIEVRAGYDKFDRGMVRVEQRARTAGGVMVREFDKADRSAGRLEATLKRTTSTLALFGGGFAGAALIKGVIDAADSMNILKGRIANVITEGESLNRVYRDLFNSAQQNRASIEGTAQLYLRLRNTMKDLNHESALAITSTFSKTLVLSGANAQEAASSLTQFAQAMGSARLQGDELRSLLENNSRFAKLLATQLGVNVGQLKALGEAGALSGELVTKALEKGGSVVDAEFANIPLTVGQAFQQLQNSIVGYVGETDSALGASQRLALGLSFLAKNIDSIGDAIVALGAGALAGGLTYGLVKSGEAVARFAVVTKEALSNIAKGTNPAYKKFAEPVTKAVLDAERALLNYQAALTNVTRAEQALTAAQAAGNSTRSLSAYKGQVTRAQKLAQSLEEAARVSGNTADRMQADFTRATNAVGTKFGQVGNIVKNIGSSILATFGGPVGLAITAASIAMAVFTHNTLEAQRATRSIQSGLELVAGLNIDVSEAAAKAAGMSEELTSAMENQKKAQDALNASKKEQLRTDLQQSVLDAKKTQTAAQNRIAELEGLNNAPFQAQALKDFRKPALEAARKDLERMNGLVPILEAGLKAVDDGLTGIGETAPKALSKTEKAVADFKAGVDALKGSIGDDQFKSSQMKNMLEALAEIDLAAARGQMGDVKNMLTPQDAVAVEKGFLRIARASITAKTSLNEFATEAERFKQAIKDIAQADPSEGNKSRAALQAILDYGKEVKNIPEAFRAIDTIKFLNPTDAERARAELRKLAEQSQANFGTEAQKAAYAYSDALNEINNAEDALIATGAQYDPAQFDAARAILRQDMLDSTRSFPADDFEELSDIIRDMFTPAEALAEKLAEIENLRAGANATENTALDRKRISMLEEEARVAGYAGEALLTLNRLRAGSGMTDAEVRNAEKSIRNAAEQGREGMKWNELTDNQKSEAASKVFADTFTQALTEGIRTGDFGDALRDTIAQKAADGLADALASVGQKLGDALFGENGLAWSIGGSLFGTGLPARAHGGKVKAGQPTMVGEAGREVFIPGSDGYIAPNSALKGTGQSWAQQGAKMIGSIRGGDLVVQGDVGTHELLRRLQMMQEAQNANLPKKIRGEFREIRRRS